MKKLSPEKQDTMRAQILQTIHLFSFKLSTQLKGEGGILALCYTLVISVYQLSGDTVLVTLLCFKNMVLFPSRQRIEEKKMYSCFYKEKSTGCAEDENTHNSQMIFSPTQEAFLYSIIYHTPKYVCLHSQSEGAGGGRVAEIT